MNKERYTLSIKFKDRSFYLWDWVLKFQTLSDLKGNIDALIDKTVLRYLITDNSNGKVILKDCDHNTITKY